MNKKILDELRKITEEEQQILNGKELDKSIYQSDFQENENYTIDSKKLLEQGKLISIRKHTRFLHFPAHTHNYVEVIYMCSGSTHHIINGNDIVLNEGELLFLNQNSIQEIYPASENDIAVNFIILPVFFDYAIKMIEAEENQLRSFLLDCMTGNNKKTGYLHFKVSDILPVQNLVENLIWTLMNHMPNKRSMNQITMGLLLLQLLNYADTLEISQNDDNQKLMIRVLSYIEENYKDGELSTLANELHYDLYWLSREIKKNTGQTYTELVQSKRLTQATYLLSNTTMNVSDIALAVGYENFSYFHRVFRQKYGCSPKKYRQSL